MSSRIARARRSEPVGATGMATRARERRPGEPLAGPQPCVHAHFGQLTRHVRLEHRRRHLPVVLRRSLVALARRESRRRAAARPWSKGHAATRATRSTGRSRRPRSRLRAGSHGRGISRRRCSRPVLHLRADQTSGRGQPPEDSPTAEVVAPFCGRAYLRAAFQFDALHRWTEPLHYQMLRTLDRRLHRMPFQSGQRRWKSQNAMWNWRRRQIWTAVTTRPALESAGPIQEAVAVAPGRLVGGSPVTRPASLS